MCHKNVYVITNLFIKVNPLYKSKHYNSKILYNVILICTEMAILFYYVFFTTANQTNVKILRNKILDKSIPWIKSLGGGGRVVKRCWVNFQCRGVLLIWITIGQGPSALAVGADRAVWTFLLSSIISLFFLPLSGRRSDID